MQGEFKICSKEEAVQSDVPALAFMHSGFLHLLGGEGRPKVAIIRDFTQGEEKT